MTLRSRRHQPLHNRVATLTAEVGQLTEERDALRDAVSNGIREQARLKTLLAEDPRVNEARELLRQARITTDTLHALHDTVRRERDEARTAGEALIRERNTLAAQSAAREDTIRALTAQYDEARAAEESLQAQRTALHSTVAEKDAVIQRLQGKIADLIEENARLIADNARLRRGQSVPPRPDDSTPLVVQYPRRAESPDDWADGYMRGHWAAGGTRTADGMLFVPEPSPL